MTQPVVEIIIQHEGMSDKETERAKEEDEEDEDAKCCSLSKFRTAFIHIALIVTSIAYIFIGALIFVHLERPYELEERHNMLSSLDILIQELINNVSSSSKTEREFESALDDYTKGIFDLIDCPHGNHIFETQFFNSSGEDMWTLSSAVLFTSTTVIPVGYGYITPISPVSRLFVVVYGLIGIPLALVTMADAGKFMSNFITQFFTTSLTIPTIIFLSLLAFYPIAGGIFFHIMTDMSLMDAIYFSLISIFTIGFGDLAPSVNVIHLVLFIVFGVILVTITIDFVAAELIDHVHYMGRHVGKAKELASKMLSLAQSINMNKGLTVGMTQLHALARFGLLGKIDENALKAPRVHVAFEPSLDDMDFMDCGVSRDIRASKLSLYNI